MKITYIYVKKNNMKQFDRSYNTKKCIFFPTLEGSLPSTAFQKLFPEEVFVKDVICKMLAFSD